jgi:hypothetical protein
VSGYLNTGDEATFLQSLDLARLELGPNATKAALAGALFHEVGVYACVRVACVALLASGGQYHHVAQGPSSTPPPLQCFLLSVLPATSTSASVRARIAALPPLLRSDGEAPSGRQTHGTSTPDFTPETLIATSIFEAPDALPMPMPPDPTAPELAWLSPAEQRLLAVLSASSRLAGMAPARIDVKWHP